MPTSYLFPLDYASTSTLGYLICIPLTPMPSHTMQITYHHYYLLRYATGCSPYYYCCCCLLPTMLTPARADNLSSPLLLLAPRYSLFLTTSVPQRDQLGGASAAVRDFETRERMRRTVQRSHRGE